MPLFGKMLASGGLEVRWDLNKVDSTAITASQEQLGVWRTNKRAACEKIICCKEADAFACNPDTGESS